jgi:hypothetical protein
MKTKQEKTLHMRLSFVMGQLWDKVNEYEVDAEQASQSKHNNIKHIKKYYAKDLRDLVENMQRHLHEINYEEVD